MNIDATKTCLKSSSNTNNAPCLYNLVLRLLQTFPVPLTFTKTKTANGFKPMISLFIRGENNLWHHRNLTEISLSQRDTTNSWELNESFKFFRCDQQNQKLCGGGVIIIIPKSSNPNFRPDLIYMSREIIESLWDECCLSISTFEKKTGDQNQL